MLKDERLNKIQKELTKSNFIKVSDITALLGVTEMTVRRDLQELESQGLLERVHGGAKKISVINKIELSHIEKQNINIEAKKKVAQKVATLISNKDTIFLGPGTTIELVYDYLDIAFAKVITNSIHVFNRFMDDKRFELILVGGSYRERTGAFIGGFVNSTLSKIRVNKSFISVNGVYNNYIYTSNEEEGITQNIILNNSNKSYIVADHNKIHREDFYSFYKLENVTALVTDEGINKDLEERYKDLTKIIY